MTNWFLKSELVMQKRGIYKYNCIATVDGVVATTANYGFASKSQAGMSNNQLFIQLPLLTRQQSLLLM